MTVGAQTVFLLATLALCNSANFLFLSPHTSYSHTHFFHYTIKELSRRGHTVTFWNGLEPRESLANVTHLHSASLHRYNSDHAIGFDANNPVQLFLTFPDRLTTICNVCYSDPVFRQLKDSRETFDLIIVEAFLNECMLPLVAHFKAPFIYMSAIPPVPWTLDATCSPMSFQHFPIMATTFTDEMDLWERTVNALAGVVMIAFRDWFILPRIDYAAAQAWAGAFPPLPPVKDIENSVRLFISNSHPVINYPFDNLGTIVEAGGLHLIPPQPLPKDVEDFLADSGDAGFIVLSFGSILRGSRIPKSLRDVLMATFARLPQRVLWKWENDTGLPNLPTNVRLFTWLPPLLDLLAHKKMKLLMTHGGLFSNQEAVWSGVPLIGMPVFGDQSHYVLKAQKDGYALHLDWRTLTEEQLYNSIQEIIYNPKYKTKAEKLSVLMRDRLDDPLERAVHAIEHTVRHKDVQHLRPASCKLSMLQREMVDVFLVVAAAAILILSAVKYLLRRLFKEKDDKLKHE